MPEIKGDYGGILKTIKATADAKLETVAAIEAGTNVIGNIDRVATVGDIAHLGSIANTEFDIGTAGRVIRVDTLGTVERVTAIDNLGTVGKLETIGMIEAGTISEVGHVGTVGDITHLGSIGNVNRIDDLGTVKECRTYMGSAGAWIPTEGDTVGLYTVPKFWGPMGYEPGYHTSLGQLWTAPGLAGSNRMALRTDSDGKLILDTLGTVERVKHINSLGTVHEGHLYTYNAGVWSSVYGTASSAFTMPGAIHNNVVYYMQCNANQELRTAPGYYEGTAVPLLTDSDYRLQTAPATSRKGGVQTVANMGTAVALVASSTPCIGVICKAVHENLGTIYVGDSTVDNTHGFQLRRDEFISFSCSNAGSVYIDASRNAQKVSFLHINY